MKRSVFLAAIAIFAFAIPGLAQTPNPTPASKKTYKTYAAAMAAGKKLIAEKKKSDAEEAFEQAAALGKTDAQKADALIEAAKSQKESYDIGSTGGKYKGTNFTIYHHPKAVQSLDTALELAGIDDEKRAEIRLLRVDVYFAASKATDSHNRLVPDIEKKANKPIVLVIREEMTALAGAAATPPDLKVEALIRKAQAFQNFRGSYTTSSDLRWAFDALKAGSEMAGASDSAKASALLQIAELARVINN